MAGEAALRERNGPAYIMKPYLLIWLLGFPLTCAVQKFLYVKRRQLERKGAITDNLWEVQSLIETAIYLGMAVYFA